MTTVRGKFRPARKLAEKARDDPGRGSRAPSGGSKTDQLARRLALAYFIDRLIEAGEVASYGEVARHLGVSQPRVSQVMRVLLLPPKHQEATLTPPTD